VTSLVGAVAQHARRLRASREAAAGSAVRVLRRIEDSVGAALAGESLRGMCNLAPRSATPLLAAHATAGDHDHGVDTFLPLGGGEVLVVDKRGRFRLAWLVDGGRGWESRPVDDEDLSAEDLSAAVDAMHLVLERHLARVVRGISNYDEIACLAARIGEAIGV
jgi:hypothetical protein